MVSGSPRMATARGGGIRLGAGDDTPEHGHSSNRRDAGRGLTMRVSPTELPGVVLIEPQVHRDGRGFFAEMFRGDWFREHGLPDDFVQDNIASSVRGVLRGLHFQYPH